MKKMLLLAGAMIAATPALAQTAPAQAGPYAGGFAGFSATSPHYAEPGYPDYSRNPSLEGISGGVFAGYTKPLGRVAAGVEVDWGLLDNNGGRDENNDFNDYTSFRAKWNAHARVKIGTELQGATVFVAGGLAAARVIADDTSDGVDSFAKTFTGLTIGGGAEQMIGGNAFVRAEYLHDSFGRSSGDMTNSGGGSYRVSLKPNTDTIRLGVGVRF